MNRLLERGLVVRRFEALPKNMSYFYQISAREENRKKISQLIGVDESKLRDLRVRDQELFHSQDCARWAERLKEAFPEARVLRDYHLHTNAHAMEILLMDHDDFELKPDILLMFPKTPETPETNVAFEIERCRKSPKRIERKLRKFAMATRIDGLIYACNDEGIQESVQKVWLARDRQEELRVGHYHEHFLMFTRNTPYIDIGSNFMFSAYKNPAWLGSWIQALRLSPRDCRRKENFKNLYGDSASVG
jgi:hypothetical protein